MNIPIKKAKSPTRFTMKAFFPAARVRDVRYQNPISRYEHNPTPSHPTNRSARLFAMTSVSMENMKRFK
jgi:hypothetical protein